MPLQTAMADAKLLNHYLNVSRLLAGQLDFRSAIRAVAAEIAHFLPHDHLDVCILMIDGKYHTAYETGIDTEWGRLDAAPVANSPIRSLLWGQEDYILTADASQDPRFHFEGACDGPIFKELLRSRVHVPIKAGGETIGALSCSSHQAGLYTERDVANARAVADLLSAYFFALRAAEQAQRSAIVEAEARAREEGLRQGALNLTEALEGERQRIGMDLHDQTLADMTRLARGLERLGLRENVSGEALVPLVQALQMSIKDLREIIDANSGQEFSAFAGRTQQEYDAPGRQMAVDNGNNIVELSAEQVEAWREAAQPVIDNWVAEMDGRGLDGQALLDEARELIARYTEEQ